MGGDDRGTEWKGMSKARFRHTEVSRKDLNHAFGLTGPPWRDMPAVLPERSEERLHERSIVMLSMAEDLGGL